MYNYTHKRKKAGAESAGGERGRGTGRPFPARLELPAGARNRRRTDTGSDRGGGFSGRPARRSLPPVAGTGPDR